MGADPDRPFHAQEVVCRPSAPTVIVIAVEPSTQERLEPIEATVDEWLQATRDVVIDERERGKVLDSKSAQVTGFIGVILALDATLAVDTLNHALGATYRILLPILYLAAVALLIIGAFAAIVGSLIPQRTAAFDRTQFQEIADGPLMLSEPIPVKRTLIRSYGFELEAESGRNSRKATALQVASVCLALGLLAVGGQAVTLGVKALAMTDSAPQNTTPPKLAPKKQERPVPPAKLKMDMVKKGADGSRKRRTR